MPDWFNLPTTGAAAVLFVAYASRNVATRIMDAAWDSLQGKLVEKGRIGSVKGLRGSCGSLLSEGHSHLNKLRNALSHFPFTEYETRVIDEEPTALINATFKLAQAARNPKTTYYDDISNPFCQLGERNGSGEHDFSRSNRNGLNACLFSAGRLTADMAEAFQQRLVELRSPSGRIPEPIAPGGLA